MLLVEYCNIDKNMNRLKELIGTKESEDDHNKFSTPK